MSTRQRTSREVSVQNEAVSDVTAVYEAEIVFTGLCSFLNLRNTNGTMPGPSVIMPVTTAEAPHTPFVAYDTREVAVTQTGGGEPFEPIPVTETVNYTDLLYRKLNGHLMTFEEDQIGWPSVLSTYDHISKKDDYWPEARDQWNRDFVPLDDEFPDHRFVAAYMHLGAGVVSAERMTDFPWEFRHEDGRPTVRAYWAQEVVYRIFPYASNALTIRLERFDGAEPVETFTFTPLRPQSKKIKIWVGNNDSRDIYRALLRYSSIPRKAAHFEYSNDVATIVGIGPVPTAIVPRRTFDPGAPDYGTGSDTGYCGPTNSNGG
jgi:hypothetical protein